MCMCLTWGGVGGEGVRELGAVGGEWVGGVYMDLEQWGGVMAV